MLPCFLARKSWPLRSHRNCPFAPAASTGMARKIPSANEIDPKQLDFRSQLFKNPRVRESFLNKALPQIRRNLCNAGFRSIRILQESDSDAGQRYPLKCQ
jgi:hypothetical protein